jgi:Ribosomal protein L7/L12 C-terminal domain
MITSMDSSDDDRIVRLERQVDFLFRHLGIDPDLALDQDDALPPAMYDLIARGKKIEAIKIYREATGVGLKEAKDAVDAIARRSGR